MLGVGDLGAKRDHFSRVDFSLGERVVFFSGWELGMRDISCVSKAVDLELLSIWSDFKVTQFIAVSEQKFGVDILSIIVNVLGSWFFFFFFEKKKLWVVTYLPAWREPIYLHEKKFGILRNKYSILPLSYSLVAQVGKTLN